MKRISIVLALTFGLFLSASTAFANATGYWVCDFNLNGSGSYPQDLTIDETAGVITGQELTSTPPNSPFANITGNANGNSLSMHFQYIGSNYYADVVGTVSGNSMTGTWSNQSQAGGFTCNRTSSTGPGSPTPTPTPHTSAKRPTSTFIFCNRIGVNLETADCAVTVGDAGPPPRSAPTGLVDLVSRNGFFPANAQCFPQQTQYSPGVVSCKVQFAIPFGFPLGIAFPIDATYNGDSVFEGSSTSHATIQAGCVGDATNPCSGAVALTFADIPQILKDKIKLIFECGSSKLPARGLLGGSICSGILSADANLGDLLSALDINGLHELADSISNKDALNDALLKAFQQLNDPRYQQQLQDAVGKQEALMDMINKIMTDIANKNKSAINNTRVLTRKIKVKKIKNISFGSTVISVKNNSRKSLKIVLSKQAAKIVKALKRAGAGDVDVKLSVKGQRSTGPKKPFKKSFTVGMLLS